MPPLSNALNAALTGLQNYQKGVQVESNNVSNALTEGYTKKIHVQKTCVLGSQSSGVTSKAPVRHVQQTLLSQIRHDLSHLNQHTVQHNFLNRIQEMLGKPGEKNNLSLALTKLENAFQGMVTYPAEVSPKILLMDAAQNLAQQIQTLANEIQKIRQDVDAQISQSVLEVNRALEDAYLLNGRIAKGMAAGLAVGELQDQRDQCLERIAEKMNIQVLELQNGRVGVQNSLGMPLLEPRVSLLSYTPTPYMSPETEYHHASTGLASTIQPLMMHGRDITLDLRGGSLKGLIELRDSFLPNIQKHMDLLATQLKTQMNEISNQGSAFPPPTSLTGSRFFQSDTEVLGPLSGMLRVASVHQTTGEVVSHDVLDLGTVQGGTPTVAQLVTALNDRYRAQDIEFSLSAGTQGYLVVRTLRNGCGVALGGVSGAQPPQGNATQGFSAFMGFNDMFLASGDANNRGVANSLQLNPLWRQQPNMIPQGLLNADPNLQVGSVGLTVGDVRNVQNLIQKMKDRSLNFPAVGSMGAMQGTLNQYAQAIISQHATLTGVRSQLVEEQKTSLEQIRTQEKNLHGVNLDQSMLNLMEYQSAYNANFQVMRIANDMLTKIEEIFR